MVGIGEVDYDRVDSALINPTHHVMHTSLSPSKRLRHIGLFLLSALIFPFSLHAQSQFAGTYFGSVNTKVSAGPFNTESALGIYTAVVTSSGAITVNGIVNGTVNASGAITFAPEATLALTTGTISNGSLSTVYGNLVGNGTTRFKLNASGSFTPSGSVGSTSGSGGGGGGSTGAFQNGSFEVGPNPGAAWIGLATGATNVTGWSVTAGSVDYMGSAWQTSNGSRSLDLSGVSAGTVAQTFDTTSGQTYTVTFDFAGNPGYGSGTGVKTMTVSVNNSGGTSQDFTFDTTGKTLGNMGWVEKTFTFTASAATTTLSFASKVNSVYGPALDNVRLNGSTGADPVANGSSTTSTILGGTAPSAPANLTSYRNKQGQNFEFIVTGSTSGTVWGTDIYTDDSSVAAAAVHAGVVAVGETKTVTISVLPGQASYTASTRRGVTTRTWGSWSGSFSFGGGTGSTGTAVVAPTLSVNPATLNINRNYAFGSPFILTVPVTGIGPFTYQWFLNNSPISGAVNGTYSLPRLTSAHAGTYRVNVTNSAGTTSVNMGSIDVSGTSAGVPQITLQPLNKVVAPGGTFSLATSATGAGLSYLWYLDGVALPNETGPVMLRTSVTPAHTGNYTVKVTNSAGSITSDPSTVTLSPTASVLVNISVRGNAAAGQIITPGFVVAGTGTKTVVIRAVGPGLSQFGVDGVMANPKLTIFDGQTAIATNDDWDSSLTSTFSALGAFGLTSGSKDAAIAVQLPANTGGKPYTVQVTGVDNSAGVVLIEVYDADTAPTSKLVNVSVLSTTAPGSDTLTLGFVLAGTGQRTLLVRGVGPTLTRFGLTTQVNDPALGIYDSNQRQILANDDWNRASYMSEMVLAANYVGAFELDDQSADAATLSLVDPGSYTVQVTGANDSSGSSLVEVYEVP